MSEVAQNPYSANLSGIWIGPQRRVILSDTQALPKIAGRAPARSQKGL